MIILVSKKSLCRSRGIFHVCTLLYALVDRIISEGILYIQGVALYFIFKLRRTIFAFVQKTDLVFLQFIREFHFFAVGII